MRYLTSLWIATMTWNKADAGTRNLLVLTVHVDGGDVLKYSFPADTANDQAPGQADLYQLDREKILKLNPDRISEDKLCRAEFRLGINGTDTWRPEHVFIWGEVIEADETTAGCSQVLPLAGETSMDVRVSLDESKGDNVWKAISRVAAGGPDEEIRRLLILVTTERAYNGGWWSSDYLTNSVRIKIGFASGHVVNELLPQSSQSYFKIGQDNCFIPAITPSMRKSQVVKDGVIVQIDGSEEWHPGNFFVFGLNNLDGSPTVMVPLTCLSKWTFGCLSQDTGKGRPWVVLPLV